MATEQEEMRKQLHDSQEEAAAPGEELEAMLRSRARRSRSSSSVVCFWREKRSKCVLTQS
jgi:hypothetical protein